MFLADKVNNEKINYWYRLGYQSLFGKASRALLGPWGTGPERVAEIEPIIGRLAQTFSHTSILACEDPSHKVFPDPRDVLKQTGLPTVC